MRILIVDDDIVARMILSRCLAGIGTCDQACNGDEGWTAYARARTEARYDLILLDIEMPGMGGGELLKRIRADEHERGLSGPRRSGISMATVHQDKESVMAAFRDEADGYIVKPYSPESVLGDLRRDGLIPKA